MKSDWSLNTDGWIANGRGHTIDKIKEDIETLRQKLIEDIKEFYSKEEPQIFDNYEEYFKYRGQRIINEIINKRFGHIEPTEDEYNCME